MKSALALVVSALFALPAGAELILVEDGEARMPIVVFENAPPFTHRAADELAAYIEKTSGARPEVLEGQPDPLPESAIWVGYQPVLEELFPDIELDFKNPEEILIAANGKNLVIAGRDVWNPDHLVVEMGRKTIDGIQQEYGTVNAASTCVVNVSKEKKGNHVQPHPSFPPDLALHGFPVRASIAGRRCRPPHGRDRFSSQLPGSPSRTVF